jgi:hypothetical protein
VTNPSIFDDPKNCSRRAALLAVGLLAIAFAFLPPAICVLDGGSMFATAYAVVTHHTLAVPAQLGAPGRYGLYYSKWYPLLSVIAMPLVALGAAAGNHFGLPPRYAAEVAALLVPAILLALNAYLTVLLALALGAGCRGALWAGIAFAFGTVALVYAREFFADPLLAALTALGMCCAFRTVQPDHPLAETVISALAVLAKPTGIVLGPCLALYAFLKRRPVLSAIAPMLGTSAGLIVYLLYNWFRFGRPFAFGQPYAFDPLGIPAAVFGLIASPGRGLLWYCPVVLALWGVPWCRCRQPEALILMLVIFSYLGFYSLWQYWPGGWSWGPRLLVPLLPELIAFTGLLDTRWRKALVTLTLIGFVVNSPNLFGTYVRYYHEANAAGISESARIWSLRQGPLIGIWRSDYHQISQALDSSNDLKAILREAGSAPLNDPFKSPCLRVVPLWWWILPAVHLPRALGAAVAILLIGLGGGAIYRAFKAA